MSVNIYNKETDELIKIAGNGGGSIDDVNVSNKTTYSSDKIEELFNDNMNEKAKENSNVGLQVLSDRNVESANKFTISESW